MAEKLVKYYELVEKRGGLHLKMRLAMRTNIPSNKAMSEPDTPENLEKFYQAVREILGPDVPKL